MVMLFVGIVLIVVGGFILWTATAGRSWNSTHNRALQPTARVSNGQQRYNATVGMIFGPAVIVAGIVCVVIGMR